MPEDLRQAALKPLQRMLDMSKSVNAHSLQASPLGA
jgi:hypothetical protein